MIRLLVFAFLVAAGTASEDLEADESAPPIQVYSLDEIHSHHQEGHHKHRPHNVHLHGVHDHKGQSKVDRIVTELNNPDYIEPITVLDYRYLKTGGRDYTRGAGGQILILPKNVRINQKKEFENYDEMLEFLRLKQLAEIEAHHKELSKLGYAHRQLGYHGRHIEIQGHPHHEHHANLHHLQQDHRGHHGHQEHFNHHHEQLNYHHELNHYGGYKRDAAEPLSQEEKQEIVEKTGVNTNS